MLPRSWLLLVVFALGASAPADVQTYVAQMNAERARCGARPLTLDARLQQVAEWRLQQVFVEFSHSPGGVAPLPPLLARAGFPVGGWINYHGEIQVNTSEGLMMGGFLPAGLGIPREQYPYERSWQPRRYTHHSDMVNPRWTMVGHAFGRSSRGIAYSVTVYGCLP